MVTERHGTANSVELRDVVLYLWRWRGLLLVLTASGALLAAAWAMLVVEPTYEASAVVQLPEPTRPPQTQVLVQPTAPDGPTFDALQAFFQYVPGPIPAGVTPETLELHVKTDPVLQNIARRLGLPAREDVLNDLKGSISFSYTPNARLLEVSATASDPQMAARIANEVAMEIVRYAQQKTQLFYQTMLERTKGALQAEGNRLTPRLRAYLQGKVEELRLLLRLQDGKLSIEVLQQAQPPNVTLERRWKATVAFGAVAGFLLGFMALFLRAILKGTLRDGNAKRE